jgi:(R,R)-butanediol dehydrogenase/meso-butanediol dehydrogenase/diacetyl reductase
VGDVGRTRREGAVPPNGRLKELSIRFSVYYRPDEFRTVIAAFESEKIDPSPLITRTVSFDDLDATFESLANSPADVKVVVDPRSTAG